MVTISVQQMDPYNAMSWAVLINGKVVQGMTGLSRRAAVVHKRDLARTAETRHD